MNYYSHFLSVLNLDKVFLTKAANLSVAKLTKAEILTYKYRDKLLNMILQQGTCR